MCPLHSDERETLLAIAREAIESEVMGRPRSRPLIETGSLGVPQGAFVTLRHRGRLKGCIGLVHPSEPLISVIAECAVAAATADPRFTRLRPVDLRDLDVEISVLSVPQQIPADEVESGVHGVIISRGVKRGVLLPQVAAERGWSRERLLEGTCLKAGLEPDAWRDAETVIEVFTAQVFSDADARSSQKKRTDPSEDRYSSSQ